MPLKVLLADDSAAIKKVVQLSLQDYGVEVKSINSGKDVLEVARKFKPDIAFVDVLLPHKPGYDVASEFRKDADLKTVPIIMLWSSFMNIDEGKFKTCGADDMLEKPFEVTGLRALISKYVPRTQSSPIAEHLDFPKVDFKEDPKPVAPTTSKEKSQWDMGSFEEIPVIVPEESEEKLNVTQATRTNYGVATQAPKPTEDESQWVRKDLSKFTVNIPDEVEEAEEPEDHSIQDLNFVLKPTGVAHGEAPPPPPKPAASESARPIEEPKVALSPDVIAKITADLKAELKDAVEKIAWKIVPEIASNVIRQELQRLLEEDK